MSDIQRDTVLAKAADSLHQPRVRDTYSPRARTSELELSRPSDYQPLVTDSTPAPPSLPWVPFLPQPGDTYSPRAQTSELELARPSDYQPLVTGSTLAPPSLPWVPFLPQPGDTYSPRAQTSELELARPSDYQPLVTGSTLAPPSLPWVPFLPQPRDTYSPRARASELEFTRTSDYQPLVTGSTPALLSLPWVPYNDEGFTNSKNIEPSPRSSLVRRDQALEVSGYRRSVWWDAELEEIPDGRRLSPLSPSIGRSGGMNNPLATGRRQSRSKAESDSLLGPWAEEEAKDGPSPSWLLSHAPEVTVPPEEEDEISTPFGIDRHLGRPILSSPRTESLSGSVNDSKSGYLGIKPPGRSYASLRMAEEPQATKPRSSLASSSHKKGALPVNKYNNAPGLSYAPSNSSSSSRTRPNSREGPRETVHQDLAPYSRPIHTGGRVTGLLHRSSRHADQSSLGGSNEQPGPKFWDPPPRLPPSSITINPESSREGNTNTGDLGRRTPKQGARFRRFATGSLNTGSARSRAGDASSSRDIEIATRLERLTVLENDGEAQRQTGCPFSGRGLDITAFEDLSILPGLSTPATEKVVDLLQTLASAAATAVRHKHKIYSILRVSLEICAYIVRIGPAPSEQRLGSVKHTLDRMAKYGQLVDALEDVLTRLSQVILPEIVPFAPEMYSSWTWSRWSFHSILISLRSSPFPEISCRHKSQEIGLQDLFFDDCSWLSRLIHVIESELSAQFPDIPQPASAVTNGLRYLQSEIYLGTQAASTRELVIDIATVLALTLSGASVDSDSEIQQGSLASQAHRDRCIQSLTGLFSTLDLGSALHASAVQSLIASWADIKMTI